MSDEEQDGVCDACRRGAHEHCHDDGRYNSLRACECYRSTHGESGGTIILALVAGWAAGRRLRWAGA